MWIPKGAALIRGGHLFEARRLLEQIRYRGPQFHYKRSIKNFDIIFIFQATRRIFLKC